jgi:GNAT superfamily N-acetyltransferase
MTAAGVPPIPTPRFELVSMSLPFMRLLLARDLAGAGAEIGAIVPPDMPDDLDDYLRDLIADPPVDPEAWPWLGRATVLSEPDGTRRIIGSCGFHDRPGPDGRVEVGCSVVADHRHQGVGTEILRALIEWARARGVDRFRASIVPGNVASVAMVERLGFRQARVELDEIDGPVLVFELDP